ncbi:hypothetical protein [Corallococcus llansteffanensis]|uniref:Uncharacterized protein n=1 Tax=Corallococcus llansteffanensis TaxID=2316731 RepID=A0A3A8Q5I9_9BACT|nr:hypothetical protein [Corallococcus llansteffanensis]RKH60202.1 hypothetical protein D7V93_13680 [Corallococcus llansteffanensis]
MAAGVVSALGLSTGARAQQAPSAEEPRAGLSAKATARPARQPVPPPAREQVPQEDPTVSQPANPGCRVDARFSGLWPRVDAVTFHPTTLEERAAFARLIPALLAAAPKQKTVPKELTEVAASVGFLLETWTTPRDTFWVLRERPDNYHGAGAYVVRTGEATEDVVQVPHPYYDIGTEDIGSALFSCPPEGRAPRLFMTATAHRYHGTPGETPEDPEHPADVAHNPDHLFQTVTDLAARSLPMPRVVQLHGFGESKIQKGRSETLAAVVSDGSRTPGTWARRVVAPLEEALGPGVKLFPEGVQVLGGTQNAQARLLQNYPGARFLHLEMSSRTRKALARPARLQRLAQILFAPLED